MANKFGERWKKFNLALNIWLDFFGVRPKLKLPKFMGATDNLAAHINYFYVQATYFFLCDLYILRNFSYGWSRVGAPRSREIIYMRHDLYYLKMASMSPQGRARSHPQNEISDDFRFWRPRYIQIWQKKKKTRTMAHTLREVMRL